MDVVDAGSLSKIMMKMRGCMMQNGKKKGSILMTSMFFVFVMLSAVVSEKMV